jgi:hypothetical protein
MCYLTPNVLNVFGSVRLILSVSEEGTPDSIALMYAIKLELKLNLR